MASIPDVVAITDLRRSAAKMVDRMKGSKEPLIVTQRGHAAAVILSVERYEAWKHERELLRRIARGEQEITEGKGHGLRGVMKEADQILNQRCDPVHRSGPR